MEQRRIDRDEYEATSAELLNRHDRQEGDVVVIAGNHADHGRVTLRCEADVFTIKADSLEFVRPWGEKMEAKV